ncbi:MAG: response regulator [Planctomycetes bacterium]|nr:response regulator [Planctomycetota bacterium]
MNKQILVIDDDLAIRKSFALAFEGTDYQVDTAESGEAGIKKASKTEYDLIFLDLKMPGINGIEVLIRLRDGGHKMPIYIITAFHKEFIEQLRIASKGDYEFEVLKKPIETDDLVGIARAVLEGDEFTTKIAKHEFRLYVVGNTPKLLKVIEQLKDFLKSILNDDYNLEVIDVMENPERAEEDRILATPTLEKVLPEPVRKVVGDLSNRQAVLSGLGLTTLEKEEAKCVNKY